MRYQSGHSADEVASYLRVSRSTVSRLLSFARESGIVEIRVRDDAGSSSGLEQELRDVFPGVTFHVVEVPMTATAGWRLAAVVRYAAPIIVDLVGPGTTIGLAWGNTVNGIIDHLPRRPVRDVSVVQLNGAGNGGGFGIAYASEIVTRFAGAFSAMHSLFPVPAFFDYPETKAALWRERSIRQILDLQSQADLLLFSTGALVGDVISHVYSDGYLSDQEADNLRAQGVVGDIGTVFFKSDGGSDLPINLRSSGPPLDLYVNASRAVCVASGNGKIPGMAAALGGGFMTDLITDELTACELLHNIYVEGNR
jgi:DNA-binding transcriptional regulator LsrR (DeoR family)